MNLFWCEMKKVLLNKNGLTKLVEYLESRIPGFKENISITSDKLIIDNDIELFVRVPIREYETPYANEREVTHMTQPETIKAEPIGKGVNTQVRRIGRAAIQKAGGAADARLVGRLSKQNPNFAKLMTTDPAEVEQKEAEQEEMKSMITNIASKLKK